MTEQETNKLLPCPFCGSEAITQEIEYGDCKITISYSVRCSNDDCWVDFEEDELDDAVKRWNSRSGEAYDKWIELTEKEFHDATIAIMSGEMK